MFVSKKRKKKKEKQFGFRQPADQPRSDGGKFEFRFFCVLETVGLSIFEAIKVWLQKNLLRGRSRRHGYPLKNILPNVYTYVCTYEPHAPSCAASCQGLSHGPGHFNSVLQQGCGSGQ
jgi:hypothetical protein